MIYAILAGFFWGIMYYSNSKIVKSGMTYSQILVFSLPLWIFLMFLLKGNEKLIDIDIAIKNKNYLLFFLCSSIIGNFLIFQSLKNADVVIIAVLEMTYPIFILLIRFFLEKERIEITQFLGIVITIFGVFLTLKKD
jgi:drug/metabolite transporter (DMT)-like permease